ncbi:hypothetical protein [Bradyrhizobium sp.]|uniref:hypothetical protein n=1 Tax=Bradyrhizobium sp. TaxID=376 RepID=UPI00403801E8
MTLLAEARLRSGLLGADGYNNDAVDPDQECHGGLVGRWSLSGGMSERGDLFGGGRSRNQG